MDGLPRPQRPSCPNRPSTQGCELVTWAVITVPLSTSLVPLLPQLYGPWLPLKFTVSPPYPASLPSSPQLLGTPKPSVITFDSHAKPKLRPQGPPRSSREQQHLPRDLLKPAALCSLSRGLPGRGSHQSKPFTEGSQLCTVSQGATCRPHFTQ